MTSGSSTSGRRPSAIRAETLAEKKVKGAEAQKKAEAEAAAVAERKEARKKVAESKVKNSKGKNSKSSTPDTTPSKPKQDKKRKTPTPELGGETEVEDHPDEPVTKKSKSSDEEDEPDTKSKSRGTTKETTTKAAKKVAATPAPVDIDYDRIIHSITDNIIAHINDSAATAINSAITNQVNRSVRTMMLPCLTLVRPFMDYALACGGLNGAKEEKAKTVGTKVHDAVKKLREDWGGSSGESGRGGR